jgi:DNA mismatch endonuclease, patch repair protein
MADVFDSATRSWIMSRVTSKGTRPEALVAESLKVAGIKYQSHRADLPGCPDFVVARQKLAIFVNGCFWHWHGCSRCRMPSSNTVYWEKKIAGNVARDKMSRSELHRLGWRYVTVWECNLKDGLKRCVRALRLLKTKS